MPSKQELEFEVLQAAGESGIGTIVFRNSMAKKLDLNLTESLCLTFLGTGKASTPTELAKLIGLTTGSTTTMLDRLEKRKFIRRKPNPNDRRGVIIEIDDSFTTDAQEMVVGIQKAHKELIARYSEKELGIIKDFLQRFAENLAVHSKKIEEGDF